MPGSVYAPELIGYVRYGRAFPPNARGAVEALCENAVADKGGGVCVMEELVLLVLSRLLRKFQQAAAGRRHGHSSISIP